MGSIILLYIFIIRVFWVYIINERINKIYISVILISKYNLKMIFKPKKLIIKYEDKKFKVKIMVLDFL